MRITQASVLALTVLALGCDRRSELPRAQDPSACRPIALGAAEQVASRNDLPVDRVVSLEGMPHQSFFAWTQEGRKRAVSKLMGTDRRILLLQDFEGEAPPTSPVVTGLLRRWRDLPREPWDEVRDGIKTRQGWEVPRDAYVLMEGYRPTGCP